MVSVEELRRQVQESDEGLAQRRQQAQQYEQQLQKEKEITNYQMYLRQRNLTDRKKDYENLKQAELQLQSYNKETEGYEEQLTPAKQGLSDYDGQVKNYQRQVDLYNNALNIARNPNINPYTLQDTELKSLVLKIKAGEPSQLQFIGDSIQRAEDELGIKFSKEEQQEIFKTLLSGEDYYPKITNVEINSIDGQRIPFTPENQYLSTLTEVQPAETGYGRIRQYLQSRAAQLKGNSPLLRVGVLTADTLLKPLAAAESNLKEQDIVGRATRFYQATKDIRPPSPSIISSLPQTKQVIVQDSARALAFTPSNVIIPSIEGKSTLSPQRVLRNNQITALQRLERGSAALNPEQLRLIQSQQLGNRTPKINMPSRNPQTTNEVRPINRPVTPLKVSMNQLYGVRTSRIDTRNLVIPRVKPINQVRLYQNIQQTRGMRGISYLPKGFKPKTSLISREVSLTSARKGRKFLIYGGRKKIKQRKGYEVFGW